MLIEIINAAQSKSNLIMLVCKGGIELTYQLKISRLCDDEDSAVQRHV